MGHLAAKAMHRATSCSLSERASPRPTFAAVIKIEPQMATLTSW
jgi:hypothetical protein